ncbi:hypothetical protein L195_g053133 [Trifolium pratense]|uniref:Uncharacterized protein n=1 Tax=Trifolium pratense TaxID=57577 RepID=A0A2K3K8X2_TRIPR|nr:hypothetical protein L195_g053133 [Trifolium pratense]
MVTGGKRGALAQGESKFAAEEVVMSGGGFDGSKSDSVVRRICSGNESSFSLLFCSFSVSFSLSI